MLAAEPLAAEPLAVAVVRAEGEAGEGISQKV